MINDFLDFVIQNNEFLEFTSNRSIRTHEVFLPSTRNEKTHHRFDNLHNQIVIQFPECGALTVDSLITRLKIGPYIFDY